MLTNKIWFIIINNILELKIGHEICLRKFRQFVCCAEKNQQEGDCQELMQVWVKKKLLYVEYHKKCLHLKTFLKVFHKNQIAVSSVQR